VLDNNDVREVCLSFPGTFESYPFGPDTPVYKVSANNKVFAITSADGELEPTVTVKSHPDDAEALRQQYSAITPGYHMNKRHWISIRLDGTVSAELMAEILQESYTLVRPRMPRQQQHG